MGSEVTPGKPTTSRYSPAEKEQAVRLVRQLRAELGTEHGERCSASRRSWATELSRCGPGCGMPISTPGHAPGVTIAEAKRIGYLGSGKAEACKCSNYLAAFRSQYWPFSSLMTGTGG